MNAKEKPGGAATQTGQGTVVNEGSTPSILPLSSGDVNLEELRRTDYVAWWRLRREFLLRQARRYVEKAQ